MIADAAAITFDCWNTLLAPDGPTLREARLAEWARIGGAFEVAPADLSASFAAFERAYRSFREGSPGAGSAAAARQVLAAAAADLPVAVHGPLVESYIGAAENARVRCAAGAERCLRALADRGIRLAVVSNVHVTPSSVLRTRLREHGLLDLFDAVCFSDEVGAHKPDPAIFREALARCGDPPPARVVHVGDSAAFDVVPARRLGLRTVRSREFVDDPATPEADLVVDRLSALEALA
jgi:HAD superfamily hydrolase (TIGR01549 family)